MSLQKYCLIALLVFCTINTFSQIRIVATAALIPNQAQRRQVEYIFSMRIIKELGYTPYVIEAYKKRGPTFFERYTPHVFYSTMNNVCLKNKGVNEGKTMIEGLRAFHFDADDIIVKITGRYHFISDYFINVVKKNPTTDAFFLLIAENKQVFTGCFAMRYKQLLAMLERFNYSHMESHMICLETECADYIKNAHQQKSLQVLFVDKVDVQGKMFFQGQTSIDQLPISTW